MRLLNLCALVLGLSGPACQRFGTPEQACEHFLRAVAEGNASAVFDALLPSTQEALHKLRRNHSKMRALIEDDYPSSERTAALARLYGADADSGRDLFVQLYPERYAKDFNLRLGTGTMRVERPAGGDARAGFSEALCQRSSGKAFRFARGPSGGWGMAELDSEWEQAQLQAHHDLNTVKKNAELYRRAQLPAQDSPSP